jgi:hypothetical protein
LDLLVIFLPSDRLLLSNHTKGSLPWAKFDDNTTIKEVAGEKGVIHVIVPPRADMASILDFPKRLQSPLRDHASNQNKLEDCLRQLLKEESATSDALRDKQDEIQTSHRREVQDLRQKVAEAEGNNNTLQQNLAKSKQQGKSMQEQLNDLHTKLVKAEDAAKQQEAKHQAVSNQIYF